MRELAQRSAAAAREIKDLIRTSEIEVESGAALVREIGSALTTIQEHVDLIHRHTDPIAVSAKEQAFGLTQVNTAVNEMDQVTQKNAAMVEEANAASATLATESSKLQTAVAAFRLPALRGAIASATYAQTVKRQTSQPARSRSALRVHGSAVIAEQWEEF